MWKKRGKKGLLVFIFLGGLVFMLGKSGLFTIKQIDLVTQNISCVDENKLKNSSGLLGQNLFFQNFKNVEKNLKEKFICIRNIGFSVFFPSKVKMDIYGRQPVASLFLLQNKEASASSILENIATPSAKQARSAYLIDNEGVVFAKDTGLINLPGIFLYEGVVSLGKKPDGNNLKNSLKILDGAKKLKLDIKIAAILDNFFVLFSYPKVIFKLDSRIDIQLASLQLILTEAKIDLNELEFIDLRFDKPLVRFAPKKK